MDYNKILRRFFEMAGRLGKTLNEVFAMVPNSYQQYSAQIREALRDNPPDEIGRDDWTYVEALIGEKPEEVLIECYHSNGKTAYYLYDVTFEDGSITWSNQREVEVEAALKVKPVMERRMNETVDLPQQEFVDVSDFEINFQDENKQFASVAIAQKAEVKNRNNRIYPKDVLEDAVERLKTRIRLTGPVAMETSHKDVRVIGDVCAVIHEVAFDAHQGVITLPKIEIVNTPSGNAVMALLDVVPAFQVSQRGVGVSHEEIDPQTGERTQVMDWLEIQGWDMVWNGDASVEDAVLTLNEEVGQNGGGQANENQQQQQQQATPPAQQQQATPPVQQKQQATPPVQRQHRSTGTFFRTNGNGLQGTHEGQEQQQEQQATPPGQQQQATPPAQQRNEQEPILNKEVVGIVQTAVEAALGPFKAKFESDHSELHQKEFYRVADEVLDEVLSKHPRFTKEQKDAIKSGVDVTSAYKQVENLDVASVTRVLSPMLEREIAQADKLVAKDAVSAWNLPSQARGNSLYLNNYGGVTYNEVINDAHISQVFNGMSYEHIVEGALDIMTRENRRGPENPDGNWVMPMNHPGMKPLAVVMDNYFRERGYHLAQETQASGVGIPINQVSMLLIPTVWRMVTAFQVAQLHPMMLMSEDIPIEKWTPQQSGKNAWEKWDALDPGDSTAIPESVLDYEHYTLAAHYTPQHVRVTPRARALTKNTVMNPTMRSTALAAREIVDVNDSMLWRALIMEALKLDAVAVTTAETGTLTGRVVAFDNPGWIPYEWVVRNATTGNVTKAGLIRNFPADDADTAASVSERTLTPVKVTYGASDTALDYDTDYTVNWLDGTITLKTTTAGNAAESDGTIKATYTYAKNMVIWDAAVPSGSTFLDHLVSLRFKVADARTMVKNRHYEPECLAWNYGLMDKISGGRNFTNEGTNAAQSINSMSQVLRYAGSESIDSTAIPEEYIICTQKMSILFGMHTPFTLTGEVITDNTADRRYFGEQFAGAGVPAPEKVSIIAVKNVP